MVKKYPFSTKAAKAMIAATIAFTPVATTAGIFGADKVEASHVQDQAHFTSVAAFEAYALEVKAASNPDAELVTALDSLDWKAAFAPVFEASATPSQKEAVAALLELQANIYAGTYSQGDLQTFITNNKEELGNLSDLEYVNYLGKVEKANYDAISNIELTENYTYSIFNTIVNSVRSTDHAGIKQYVADVLVIDNVKLSQVVTNIEAHLSTNNVTRPELKAAMIKAGTAWLANYGAEHSDGNVGGGGGGTDDNGGVEGPDDEDGPVVVDPVVVEGTTEIVVTIPETLQTQIVDAAQPETTEVIIEVPVSEDGKPVVLDIPVSLAAALKTAAPNADIVIQSGDVSYVIPVSKINLTALSASLGGSLDGVSLRINLEKLPTQRVNNLQGLIRSQVGAPTSAASSETSAAAVSNVNIVAPAIEVTVELVKNDTVVQELKSFGSVYVNQEFVLDTQVDTNRTTGVSVEADGSFKALPTTFKSEDGKQIAVVKTLANAGDVYTVLESSVTFPDVDGGKNWAEKYIESLSSKFIISGTTAGTYKPDQDMTRSQFAFLLSRALGLPGTTAYDGRFSDVEGDEWFNANGEFMAAVQYGVIAGKTDGTFGADEKVTRAEAAAMIGRAMELGFIEFDKGQLDPSKTLAGFKDAKEIGASTRAEVLKVVQAGIMSGASNGEFNPNDYTKRDQMARILAEFLMKADLMQNIK